MPFYSEERGWLGAGELEIGEPIRKADGSTGTVTSLAIVTESQDMWNLTVAEAHTFFVGDGEWLVHNTCRYPQTNYDDNELSEVAQQYRLDLRNSADTRLRRMSSRQNLAVFEVSDLTPTEIRQLRLRGEIDVMDGRYVIAMGQPNIRQADLHAEQIGLSWIRGAEIDPSRVRSAYSEFAPCSSCRGRLNTLLSNGIEVSYSFAWSPSGRRQRRQAFAELFQNGTPFIFNILR